MRIAYFFVLVFMSLFCNAQQLVNTEAMRMQSDTTGWLGGIGTSFSLAKNVNQVLGASANAHLQYKSNRSLYLFLADYNLLKSENSKLLDNMFYHLRYNWKYDNVIRWEVFTQLQNNKITNIALRALAGTGPRFKLHDGKKLKLYAGTAAMYEYEKELATPAIYHHDMRNTSYVSITWLPSPIIKLIATTYYQPLFSRIKDFRVLNQVSLNIKASRHFAITTNWNYLFDAFPATGVPNTTYAVSNGFSYTF